MVIIKMDGFAESSYETEMGIRYFFVPFDI